MLRRFVAHPTLSFGAVSALAAVAGILEAAVLVLVADVAFAVADDGDAAGGGVIASIPGLDPTVPTMLVAAAVAGVSLLIVHVVLGRLSTRISSSVLRTTRERSIESYIGAEWRYQSIAREGALQETVSTLATQSSVLAQNWILAGAAILSLTAMLVVAMMVSAVATLLVVALGLAMFGLIRPVTSATRRRAAEYVRVNADFNENVATLADMAMEARVFGVQDTIVESAKRKNRAVSLQMFKMRFATRLGTDLYRDLAILFLVGGVTALYLVGRGSAAELGVVLLLIVRALMYATNVQSALQVVNEQAPNLRELVRRCDEMEAGAATDGSLEGIGQSGIRLAGVGYTYPNGRVALDAIDLEIPHGEALGIVGPSGSGKSTLLQVLLRLRTPTNGSVFVDGMPYEQYTRSAWSSFISLVPQEPKLVEGTIADNIRFFRSDIGDTDVELAAERAHVADDVRALADGFATMLGPSGSGLSGGQKQRIAIARALVGRPRVLVLDEPTSALDPVSERRLLDTIRELHGEVTLVIVAHRFSTLESCDRIIRVADGRIEETDDPLSLGLGDVDAVDGNRDSGVQSDTGLALDLGAVHDAVPSSPSPGNGVPVERPPAATPTQWSPPSPHA